MNVKLNNLEKAQLLLSEEKVTENDRYESELGLEEFVIETIKANVLSTMGIRYSPEGVMVTVISLSNTKLMVFPNYSPDDYKSFCKEILTIDLEEKENCSRSINVEGVMTRVYAVMPPYTIYPNVTISTTKQPPAKLDKQTISDEVFDKIVHDNFIIVGASGSGKTYLMNYLLNKFIKDDERVGIIEEFMELIPPNQLCTSLICPPPKSNEKSKLRFITEQSNLMRLDAIYVGEIKGAEAWPFVVNLASGTRGAATLHGDSATHALSRLRALCQLETENTEAINEFIAKSIKYVIVMKKRKIDAIYRLTGTFNRNTFAMEEINS